MAESTGTPSESTDGLAGLPLSTPSPVISATATAGAQHAQGTPGGKQWLGGIASGLSSGVKSLKSLASVPQAGAVPVAATPSKSQHAVKRSDSHSVDVSSVADMKPVATSASSMPAVASKAGGAPGRNTKSNISVEDKSINKSTNSKDPKSTISNAAAGLFSAVANAKSSIAAGASEIKEKLAAAAAERRKAAALLTSAAEKPAAPSLLGLDLKGMFQTGAALTPFVAGTTADVLERCVAAGTVHICWYRVINGGAHLQPLNTWESKTYEFSADLYAAYASIRQHIMPTLTYIPNCDDVGHRIQFRAWDPADPTNFGFADTGTISLDKEATALMDAMTTTTEETAPVLLVDGIQLSSLIVAELPTKSEGDSECKPNVFQGWLHGHLTDSDASRSGDDALLDAIRSIPFSEDEELELAIENIGGNCQAVLKKLAVDGNDAEERLEMRVPSIDGKPSLYCVSHPFKQRMCSIMWRDSATDSSTAPARLIIVTFNCSSIQQRDAVILSTRKVRAQVTDTSELLVTVRTLACHALHWTDTQDVDAWVPAGDEPGEEGGVYEEIDRKQSLSSDGHAAPHDAVNVAEEALNLSEDSETAPVSVLAQREAPPTETGSLTTVAPLEANALEGGASPEPHVPLSAFIEAEVAAVNPPSESSAATDALRSQLAAVQQQLAEKTEQVQIANAKLSEMNANVATLVQSNARLTEEQKKAQASIASLSEEIKSLRAKANKAVEETDTARASLTSTKNELAEARKRVETVQKQMQQNVALLAATRTELDEVRRELQQTTARADETADEAASKARQLAKVTAALEDAKKSATTQVDDIKRQHDTAVSERDKLSAELKEATQRLEALTSRTLQSETAGSSMAARLSSLEIECATLRTERDDLRLALDATSKRVSDQTSAEAGVRVELLELREKDVRASAEISALRQRVAEMGKELDSLKDERNELQRANQSSQSDTTALRSQVATLEGKVKKFTASADTAKSLATEVSTLREQIDALTAERNAAIRRAESLRKDVARMTGGSEELKSTNIDTLMQAKRKLEEKVVKLSDDNVALQDEVERLRGGARPAMLPFAAPHSAPAGGYMAGSGVSSGPGTGVTMPHAASAHVPGPALASPGFPSSSASPRPSAVPSFPPFPSSSASPRPSAVPSSPLSFLNTNNTNNTGGLNSFNTGTQAAPHPSGGMGMHALGTATGTSSSSGGSGSVVKELQRVANALSEQLQEKEEALAAQKQLKEALAARIGELEGQLAAATRRT